jgi:hypothetical protein
VLIGRSFVALGLAACSPNNFTGASDRQGAGTNSTGTGTNTSADANGIPGTGTSANTGTGNGVDGNNNGPNNGSNGSTVYVPVGGTVSTGQPGGCTTADPKVATCNNGTVTGVKIGTTTAQSGTIGSQGASAGPPVTVVVYDPKNPPAGLDTANGGPLGTIATGTGTAALNPATTLVEEGGTLTLPGIHTQTVTVQFEDTDGSRDKDLDTKDVSICFTGDFKVDGSNFVTGKDQDMLFQTALIAAPCLEHQVTVTGYDNQTNAVVGTPFTYDTRQLNQFTQHYPGDTRIEITMTVTAPNGCGAHPVASRTQHDPEPFATVAPHVCFPASPGAPVSQSITP